MAGKAKDYDGGTRIADRRKEWGLTQDELADRIGELADRRYLLLKMVVNLRFKQKFH